MQTPHILIVEDELVTRNTLKSIFEAEGYIVLEANNGDEMHQALTSHTINLVIMDINLPGKNGLLLARELREGRQHRPDVPDRSRQRSGQDPGAGDRCRRLHHQAVQPRELTIRARNLLSRTMNVAAGGEEKKLVERYLFNGWALDINSRALVSPAGDMFKLPPPSSAPCCISARTRARSRPVPSCSRR